MTLCPQKLLLASLAVVAAGVADPGNAASASPMAGISGPGYRADALLARMTLQEKIGQLTQIAPFLVGPENTPREVLIRQGNAGSVLWTIDSDQIRRWQEIAVKESRLGIPLLFGQDVIHGYKNIFPVPIAMAASWDPSMVERAQAIAANEASVSGINWTFGPMVDIARDARWGRMVEGAGEDPFLGAAMARAQVLGFQGPRLGTPGRVLACAKHFAGYGAVDGGRDYDNVYLPEELFRNVYLRPFRAAIDAGAGSVMSAYVSLNDVPASGNVWLLRQVLRRDLGFGGFVVSDAYAVKSLVAHGLAKDTVDASGRALLAGVNVDMASETYLRNAAKAVQSGQVPLPVIDGLVREELEVKLRLGLFEHPFADLARKQAVLNDPAHRAATREAARRSMVLLKNEGGLLPLRKDVASIAVIGPIADSEEEIKGFGPLEKGPAVSVLEGLRNKLPHAKITFARGGDMRRAFPLPWEAENHTKVPALMPEDQMRREEQRAVAAARQADVVILVLGERANMASEAASSAKLMLQGNQERLLEEVAAVGKPVVLVLINGRPLDITWADGHVPAILEAWFPGTEGGDAIADVLFGDCDPGGKLPVTWPRSVGQCPVYYDRNLTQTHEDDPFFTSRYSDETSAPLYPFGYGLSYTTFAFSHLVVDRSSVSVEVANTGPVSGDEVVQLYVHQRAGGAVRPRRELKGFERVRLAAGETRTVRFTLDPSDLRYWSPVTRSWVFEPGTFDVWVGGDSNAALHGLMGKAD